MISVKRVKANDVRTFLQINQPFHKESLRPTDCDVH